MLKHMTVYRPPIEPAAVSEGLATQTRGTTAQWRKALRVRGGQILCLALPAIDR